MKQKRMKRIVAIFLKIIIVLVLLAGILFFTSKLLEQKIIDRAITELNNQLEVPIYVNKVSFSLLRKFPDATLQLNDVTLFSAKNFNRNSFTEEYTDTLVYLKELFLSVNLVSLMSNQLDITKAYAQKGQINILVDKTGLGNYTILKQKKTKVISDSTKRNLVFMLNQIQLKQVELRFINKYKNTAVNLYAPNYTLKGKFYKEEYSASSSGKLFLNYFEQGKLKIHPDNPARLQVNLSVNNNEISITNSKLEMRELHLNINGQVSLKKSTTVDLKISGNSNNINELIGFFGDNIGNRITSYGKLGISAAIKGVIDQKNSPAILANFKLVNGSLHEKQVGFFIDKIEFEGSFSNGDYRNLSTSRITFSKFYMATENSYVNGTIEVVDFNKLKLKLAGEASLELIDFDRFISSKSNYLFEGLVTGNFKSQGYFNPKDIYGYGGFEHWEKSGEFVLANVNFSMNNPQLRMHDFESQLSINTKDLNFKNASGQVQNSKLKAEVNISDFFAILVDTTKAININAQVIADKIDYNKFKHVFEHEADESENRIINISADFRSDYFYYDKFIAERVSGQLNYLDEKLQITELDFKTMEGEVNGHVNYIPQSNNNYLFQTHTTTKNVNINTLFSTFDNFGQAYIKDENLEGYLTSDFDLELVFNNGKFVSKSIEMLGHVRIDNGKLMNFQPIYEVSRFSEIDELRNIEFSSLENDVLISNSVVNIPQMNIASNAFDISLYGNQKFNGDYEYHLRIYLSDFMGGKSKRLAKQQSAFGYVEDDGFGKNTLYLLATSQNNKSKVKLDSDEIKANLKTGIQEEKKEFKKALHDEFGWFKKDTTLNNMDNKQKKQEFIIEWDEE